MRDLEIYIRDVDLATLQDWLSSNLEQWQPEPGFADPSPEARPLKARASFGDCLIRVSVYPQAGGKRYASLIIEGDELPWASDLECGRSAWLALATEIRCSPGDWKEGQVVDDERWWRIDQRGEQLAVWN